MVDGVLNSTLYRAAALVGARLVRPFPQRQCYTTQRPALAPLLRTPRAVQPVAGRVAPAVPAEG